MDFRNTTNTHKSIKVKKYRHKLQWLVLFMLEREGERLTVFIGKEGKRER
jgi:hypothetical protein